MTSVSGIPLQGPDGSMDHLIEGALWDYQPPHDDPLNGAILSDWMAVGEDDHSPDLALVNELNGRSKNLRDGHWLKDLLPSFVVASRHGTNVPSRTAPRRGGVSQDLVTGAIRNRSSEHKNCRIYNLLQPFVVAICDTVTHQPAVAIGFEPQPSAPVARLHRALRPRATIWLRYGSSGWLSIGSSGSLPVFEIGRAG